MAVVLPLSICAYRDTIQSLIPPHASGILTAIPIFLNLDNLSFSVLSKFAMILYWVSDEGSAAACFKLKNDQLLSIVLDSKEHSASSDASPPKRILPVDQDLDLQNRKIYI